MRILLVSQMYPSRAHPALGSFVQQLELALAERGHTFARAVVDSPGGHARHVRLAGDVLRDRRRFRPDVVYAHFLFPAGWLATVAGGAPVVLTAHGQDVASALSSAVLRRFTAHAVRRAHTVVAVSVWLRERLLEAVPDARGKVEVVNCGVDTARFRVRDGEEARAAVGWQPRGTGFLCLGSLSERKNVLALADAFAARGEGSLAFVGDGPLRGALAGRPNVTVAGPVAHEAVPDWVAACDVLCQPSLVEPFGLAALEGMASGRSVVASTEGGPPEFVPPEAGVLADPGDPHALRRALDAAAALPRPNLAARAAAEAHDIRRQAERIEALLQRAAG